RIWLDPSDAQACPQAIEAIEQADWVVLGPGSWYTSVIPHLLIKDLAAAVTSDKVKRLVTLNLTNQGGETSGYTAADHIAALCQYTGGARLDVVIADPSSVDNEAALRAQTAKTGARLLIRPVRMSDLSARHDSLLLAAAYREAFVAAQGPEE
ncbi:MAG: 2-phospho-L-lactate transferase CofD family protein, partial [Micrococcales bacterium]|nr:2-phospho-L-lactate transferase CofD family protein [Micrococcales bacterium]